MHVELLGYDDDLEHQLTQPRDAIGHIEDKVIGGLIDTCLYVEHLLRIHRRLIEDLAVVFIVKGHGLHLQITVHG